MVLYIEHRVEVENFVEIHCFFHYVEAFQL